MKGLMGSVLWPPSVRGCVYAGWLAGSSVIPYASEAATAPTRLLVYVYLDTLPSSTNPPIRHPTPPTAPPSTPPPTTQPARPICPDRQPRTNQRPTSTPSNKKETYLDTTTSVRASPSSSSLPALRSSTVSAPAARPAAMSSTLSPTMITGRAALPSDGDGTGSCQLRAMCQMPSGEGLGGRKARVMIGSNGVRCGGRWWVRRWWTGALSTRSQSFAEGLHLTCRA